MEPKQEWRKAADNSEYAALTNDDGLFITGKQDEMEQLLEYLQALENKAKELAITVREQRLNLTELEQELALLYARSETPGFIKDLLAQNAELEQERDSLRLALEANPRIQHLGQFPHVQPNQWEQMAIAALAHEPVKEEAE